MSVYMPTVRSAVVTALFFGGVLPSAFAADAQSAPAPDVQEWFVGVQEVSFTPPVRQLIRMDPLTGKITVLLEKKGSAYLPNVNLMDVRGKHLGVKSVRTGTVSRIEPDEPRPGEPQRLFRETELRAHVPMALSPDGRKLAAVDGINRRLVVDNNDKVHSAPLRWCVSEKPLAWNHDSTQVAFYYSDDLNDDDIHIQKHGVAVLSVEGVLRSLIPPDEKTRTPESTAKYIPPGWGRSGRYVYYTAALAPDDPDRAGEAVRSLVAIRNGTYRIEVATGKIEKLGLGDFYCVSTNEDYLLMYPAPRRTEDGKWKCGTSKVDLKTKAVTELPSEVWTPILSPSGRYVACMPSNTNDAVTFFRTDDWKSYGKPVQLSRDRPLLCGDAWINHCRWIVPDGEKTP